MHCLCAQIHCCEGISALPVSAGGAACWYLGSFDEEQWDLLDSSCLLGCQSEIFQEASWKFHPGRGRLKTDLAAE